MREFPPVSGQQVYAVHAVQPEEIAVTEVIWTDQGKSEVYARELSTDPGVLAGAVTRFVLNAPGERYPVAVYVGGERQKVPHVSDDRAICANGYANRASRHWRG